MIIGQANSPRTFAETRPETGKKKDSFWKDRADEVREALLFVDQEKLEDAGRIVKAIGSGLKGAWKQIKEIPAKLFDLPILEGKIDEEKQRELVGLAETLGRIAGFVAVGGHALGGALKVASGHQQRDTSRKLDGVMDMATAAALGATVAGMTGARAVLAPLAATFNIFRGSYNAAHGYRTNDGREQLQGLLDAFRSAGSAGRLLKVHGAFFNVAGIALAPIAGAIQAGRGVHDLSTGLKNNDNKRELQGLVDIATAVGTGMAFASGVAVIPGVALAVAANVTKVAYELSPRVREKLDPVIDRWEPKMARLVESLEQRSEPVRKAWKRLVGRFVKQQEPEGLGRYSRAQLAEIGGLLLADGEYSRYEERRLRTTLERGGQGAETPGRDKQPVPLERETLLAELDTRSRRKEFLRFLLLVSHFDNQEAPEEVRYLDELGSVLGFGEEDMAALRQERSRAFGLSVLTHP